MCRKIEICRQCGRFLTIRDSENSKVTCYLCTASFKSLFKFDRYDDDDDEVVDEQIVKSFERNEIPEGCEYMTEQCLVEWNKKEVGYVVA